MALACRICRVSLLAESGCAVCLPLRANLVTVEEDQDEKPDLGDVAAETVALLRRQVRHYRKELDETPNSDHVFTKLNQAANTIAKMVEAARKLQVDADGVIKSMSFVARAKLFIQWFAELPPPYRRQIREQMDRFELEMAKPLELPGE